jgi:hypothetical protein
MLYDSSGVRVMEFNANFNNISVISWCSILLVKETGENHQHVKGQTTQWPKEKG